MGGTNAQGLTEREFLSKYNPEKYEHPSVTVDTLIFTVDKGDEDDRLRILLIQRRDHPFLHKWAIPGRFVGMRESVDQAAARELEEKTGLRPEDIYLEQLYTWGDVERDPRTRIISISYMALIPGEMFIRGEKQGRLPAAFAGKNGENPEKAAWYWVSAREGGLRLWNEDGELPRENLAFDHGKMIQLALERMKNKVFYTDIAFKLLPDKFTLSELQRLFEAILGEKLHTPNFRRDMGKWVEQTQEIYRPQRAGKPARYYRQRRDLTL